MRTRYPAHLSVPDTHNNNAILLDYYYYYYCYSLYTNYAARGTIAVCPTSILLSYYGIP